jgi:hypothetical protein
MILTYLLLSASRQVSNPGGLILTGFLFLVGLSTARFLGLVTNQQFGITAFLLITGLIGLFAISIKQEGESGM